VRVAESELDQERAVVADLYRRLDDLRSDTERRLAEVRAERPTGTHQSRSERDSFARMYEDRLLQLREVGARLVLGRLLLAEPARAPDGGDEDAAARLADPRLRYVGRVGLRDDDQRSVLIDWRAPQASPFYQATAEHPLGVTARRHLTMRDRTVLRLDDEVFDESLLSGSDAASVRGDGALMAAVSAQRTGRMHDIVATIQAEQDRIIRSDLRGALVVQGAPGTGKTAVALHRAAYLLYTHRERLGRSGVLVVGPSPAFLRYIEAVLPSLGETGVVMRSVGELFPGVDAPEDDAPEAAAIKGSLRMARLIAQAVHSRQRVPGAEQTVEVNGERLSVPPQLIADAMARAQRTGKPHNQARVTFVSHALDDLADRLAAQLKVGGSVIDDADRAVLREDLRTSDDVRVLLNTAWLPLTPEKLLQDLYARPAWFAELTPRWSAADRSALLRPRDAPFTVSDVPLLDEAAEFLGPSPQSTRQSLLERDLQQQRERDLESARIAIENMGEVIENVAVGEFVTPEALVSQLSDRPVDQTTADRAEADRTWTYGHVVVDEAQELSPMQWRMLVRRCPTQSFTIVGDIAQASSAAGAVRWADALGPSFRDSWRLEELTVNYRSPAQIARAADRFARDHGLPVTPARAVREGDWPVERVTVPAAAAAVDGPADAADATDAAASLAESVVEAVGRGRPEASVGGTLAVIAPAVEIDAIAERLADAFGPDVGRGASGLDLPIAVLSARDAKGLEFDVVVLVDPDAIVAESSRGASAVYVAMTRPTQRLIIVAREGAMAHRS
jgi:Superfamily I DNA and RNA helicases